MLDQFDQAEAIDDGRGDILEEAGTGYESRRRDQGRFIGTETTRSSFHPH